MKRTLWIIMFLVLSGSVCLQAQNTVTNLLNHDWTAKPAPQNPATNTVNANPGTNIIPLISFSEMPLTTAIDCLARQANINYLLDPQVVESWEDASSGIVREPTLNLRVEHVTAKDELEQILGDHDLKLVDDPVSQVAIVMPLGQSPYPVNANLLAITTNISANDVLYTNDVIPLFKFSDVPLSTAFDNLFRQAGLKYRLNSGMFDQNEPTVSLRWTDLTAKQAILALCKAYHLVLVNDADGVIRVQPAPVKKHHHLLLQ